MLLYFVLAFSCVMSVTLAQGIPDYSTELHIPAMTKEDHRVRVFYSNPQLRIVYSGAGNLSIFGENNSIYTSRTDEGAYIPFDCRLFKVASKSKDEIVLTLLPEKTIPAERRVAPGRIVVLEKSSCGLGSVGNKYYLAGIHSGDDNLRFDFQKYDDFAAKAKIYRLNDTVESKGVRHVVKNILPADKEYPGWVEFEEVSAKSEEKK